LACACRSGDASTRTHAAAGRDAGVVREARPRPRPAPQYSVFDLVDNRALAHLSRGGGPLVITGTGAVAKYLRLGRAHRVWKREKRDGERAGALRREQIVFEIPLPEGSAARVLSARVHAPRSTRLTIRVSPADGKRVQRRFDLEAGWQVLSMPLGELGEGLARVRLRFAVAGAAVGWLQVSPRASAAQPPRIFDPRTSSVRLSRGIGVSYYVIVPRGAALVAKLRGSKGCVVRVSAEAHDQRVDGELRAGRGRVELGALAGSPARLDLALTGCERAELRRPRLTVPGRAPKVAERGPAPKNIILWIMDTLRADRMALFQPGARARTPVLRKLAESGAVFRRYYVQGNESQTSHSSIWTGLYPAVHTVITAGPHMQNRLSPKLPQIAPLLGKLGRGTVGASSNGTLHSWTGYPHGFDAFKNLMRDKKEHRVRYYVPGNRVLARGLAMLRDKGIANPFYLFLGTTDTHKPWHAHEPWISEYDPKPYRGSFDTYVPVYESGLGVVPGTAICKNVLSDRDMARVLAIYDSNISWQDALVGRLLAKLEAWGIADETMLIITADHGEELWEYPEKCGHGTSVRESLVRVPLLIHYPPAIPAAVVDAGAEGVDILPTIMDALGESPVPGVQGRSLIPLAHGVAAAYPSPTYATFHELGHTVRLERWKMWVGLKARPTLHDVKVDPNEYRNVIGERPIAARLLRDVMGIFLAHRHVWKKRVWGTASNMTPAGARALER
jgi:arylsulfatase A-like enzyme